jgi:hypothetical protein
MRYQNAIDLDLRDIKAQLSIGTESSAASAERIYREGAHSHPVALITLDSPLPRDIPKGTQVTGVARSSRYLVTGRAKEAWNQGNVIVTVEYAISPDPSHVSRTIPSRVSLLEHREAEQTHVEFAIFLHSRPLV